MSLAFLRWEKRSLAATEAFWRDFGLAVVSANDQRIVARGTGTAACLAVAQRGSANRFAGLVFAMSDDTDLGAYAALGARPIDPAGIPGGGQGVSLTDPAGNEVWLVQGQQPLPPLPDRAPVTALTNTPGQAVRINQGVRTPLAPPRVVRLGHAVLMVVDLATVLGWYQRVLGLIPSDCQYLADGSLVLAFNRLDLGSEPADHHVLALAAGLANGFGHSAYELLDIDAVGQGHQVLRARGHHHHWGLGRHLLGSQIFDYWHDPDGFEYEHYADGDLFTADIPTAYSPASLSDIWAWGDDVPAGMLPRMNLKTMWQTLRLLRSGQLTINRLKLLKQAFATPARPWL